MSAYMVDREHIAYLVAAAESYRLLSYIARDMGITGTDKALRIAIANELQDANRRSIEARYPDTEGHPENAPGDITAYEPYTIGEIDGLCWPTLNPVQVLKACDCYEYQACEFEEWENSKAHKVLNRIRNHAIGELPGYDNAEWGAPEPQLGLIRLID